MIVADRAIRDGATVARGNSAAVAAVQDTIARHQTTVEGPAGEGVHGTTAADRKICRRVSAERAIGNGYDADGVNCTAAFTGDIFAECTSIDRYGFRTVDGSAL